MQLPQTVEVEGIRVLTTKQIAKEYGTNESAIRTNFSRNRTKFVERKHYIALTGDELRKFKDDITRCNAVKGNDITHCNAVGIRTNLLYLWTEKGALLHAKSLNTDKAWQVYDYLVDFYFRVKEKEPEIPEKKEVVPTKVKTEPVKKKIEVPYMDEPIFVFKNLLALAEDQGITLKLKDISGYSSILRGKRIAVRKHQVFEKVVYETAYELAHYFIHYDQGDMVNSPLEKDYNEQAERAAFMMIRMLDIKAKQKY